MPRRRRRPRRPRRPRRTISTSSSARIALYPDDLVAIILPASTNPLQIVQADRFLEKRKTDPKAPVDEKWDDAVKSLLNYPEVVKKMSADLDWTAALGEAVVADQGAVLEAVQAFRRKAQAAGNLKTDDKQTSWSRRRSSRSCRPTRRSSTCRSTTRPPSSSQRGAGLRLLPYAVSGLLLPVSTRRRVRDRPDLGRGDRFGVARTTAHYGQQQHQHQPRHQHQSQHQHPTPAASTAETRTPGGGEGNAWKPSQTPAQVGSGRAPETGTRAGRAGVRGPVRVQARHARRR